MLGSQTARRAMSAILRSPCSWITSPALLEELRDVPLRPKFEGVITAEVVEELLHQLRHHARLVHPRTAVQICRDPRDNHVLAAALDGQATYLVTGDRDLLSLSPFHGMAIVTPAEFLAALTRS